MRTFCTGLVVFALGAMLGCSGSSTGSSDKHPGGPGAATNPTQKTPSVGESEGTFDLKPPSSVSLKQGDQKEERIDIKRGKNFDKDVTLKFTDIPKDVEIKPASPVIKHGDTGVVIMVTAKDTAAVGTHTVHITGHPTAGKDAAASMDLKISAK